MLNLATGTNNGTLIMREARKQSGQERRNHCRVDDNIILEYFVLDKTTANKEFSNNESTLQILQNVANEIKDIDNNHAALLAEIHNIEPKIASYLRAIDKKIETLTAFLSTGALVKMLAAPEQPTTQRVNISAGGLAFFQDKPLKKDIPLKLKCILLPNYECIITEANVVNCTASDEPELPGKYRISVAFTNLSDADEQKIVKHIYKHQLTLRQKTSK